MPKAKNGTRGRARKPETLDYSIAAQGKRIGWLRWHYRWSNNEMALRCGLRPQQLSHFIYGSKQSISTVQIVRIAMACKVSTDWIISGRRHPADEPVLKYFWPEQAEL